MPSSGRTQRSVAASLAFALASAGAAGFARPAGAVKFRAVYSARNTTALPGELLGLEGRPPIGDADAEAAYSHAGDVYDAFWSFWNRDSYNGLGWDIPITVHYSASYCNAFWDGTRFVFGDGNPAIDCSSPARSRDVFAHEYAKALTASESGLLSFGEPGGVSHGLGDVFAAFVDAWVAGEGTGTLAPRPETWEIGEDVFVDPLRFLNDPAGDGVSRDYWTPTVGSVDPAFSSGILRLAFYLLAQGGLHPRGKSQVVVPAIGMEKAIRIFYLANTNHLTAGSSFAGARSACLQAASALGYTVDEQNAVKDAWAAVGVGSPAGPPVPPPPPPPDPVDVLLVNRVPVPGLSAPSGDMRFFKLEVPAGASNLRFVIAGGSGDADLYVLFGSRPTTSSYSCRPYLNGNNETCPIAAPAAGTHYVMLRAYSTYSGVTLTGSYDLAPPPGDPVLVAGVPVTNIAGASGSNKYWRIARAAGQRLTVRISGGFGDADLYVRFAERPTTTTFHCRPYLSSSNETCTVGNTSAADYYIMLRGYSAYSGVTLVATD